MTVVETPDQANQKTVDFMKSQFEGLDAVVDRSHPKFRDYMTNRSKAQSIFQRMEMSFGMGINGYPAISMTQHAANKYAQWLSARTGHFYRLPTEAEWEYACRADGAAGELDDVAWHAGNIDGKYAKAGAKKPNAWGLYDMLGNVMEWTLDAYAPYAAGAWKWPWTKSRTSYPHAVRGGSWNDKAAQVTCTARVASAASWKIQDPQLPKSIWYLTDAQWLGFRVVRPLKISSVAEMESMWNNGVEVEP